MNGSPAIPQGLRQQFDELEQRLWRFDTIVAGCGSLFSLLLSYAFLFFSDRFWDTPEWLRVAATAAGVVACGCFFYGYGSRWVWGNRSLPALASLVQKRYRRLGDRLLGIVELADEERRPANFSAALCKAAIGQVADEAAKFDFREAVGTQRPRRYLTGATLALLIAAAACIAAPQAGWNALLRWLQPVNDVPRYTFVNLDNLPERLVVAHGEPFNLTVGLSAHSLLHPDRVTAQFEKQSPITAPVRSGMAAFHLPGQTQAGVLTLSAGDVSRTIKIEPAYRPELEQIIAHIEFPEYLLYPPAHQKVEGGTLTLLEGSRVTLKGTVTRPLQKAVLDGKKPLPLKVEGRGFVTKPETPDEAEQLAFTWRDTTGLDAAAPAKLKLQLREDSAPQVECKGLPAAMAILEDEVVRIDIEAGDDYGIRKAGVRWQTSSQRANEAAESLHERKVSDGGTQMRTVKCRFDFSPKLLGIPPDTGVSFWATAVDRYPNRVPSLSAVHQIYVLGRESHARLIQEELEKQTSRFEELTRRQEALMEAGKSVRQQSPEKLANQVSGKKLGDQSAEQEAIGKELERLTQQTADTLREASRNPSLSPSILEEWAKQARMMSGLATQAMPEAGKSLDNASADSGSRPQKLDEALAREKEILEQMRQMQKSSEHSMQMLMTQNIAMRLRKIAATEKGISERFRKILPEVIGMKGPQLPAGSRELVDGMANSHEVARTESGKLHSEIERLFERTSLEKYGNISQEMEALGTDDALSKLTGIIRDNVSVQAMQAATAWSKQFNLWADIIGNKDDTKTAGRGNQGNGGAQGTAKALMALLQLRQQEDSLRDRTDAIEQQKSSNANYGDDASAAATRQDEILQSLGELQEDAEFPVPGQDLGRIAKAMQDAKTLLNTPQTGAPTIAAETDAINLLDAAILGLGKKSGNGMSGLVGMMGLGGSSAGGSTAGGDTNRSNTTVPGSREGAMAEARRILHASGGADSQVPAEFRDAIESYQRAIEQEGRIR